MNVVSEGGGSGSGRKVAGVEEKEAVSRSIYSHTDSSSTAISCLFHCSVMNGLYRVK